MSAIIVSMSAVGLLNAKIHAQPKAESQSRTRVIRAQAPTRASPLHMGENTLATRGYLQSVSTGSIYSARRSTAIRASEKASTSTTSISLPEGPDETVQQATAAINAALADGYRLLDVEFLLPLIGATDLDDWPGGVRQQFKAAAPMVEDILRNTTV